jgi:hypothetical protein
MKHKNPGASNIFPHKNSNSEETKRIGTPKSSETKRPTINIDEDYTMTNGPEVKMCSILCPKKASRFFASVAQQAEQGFCKPQVVGSIPITSSSLF